MEHNNDQRCRNCQHPLPEGARFCPACGQKNTDGRLTFREMVAMFFETLFNLDNRIFSTLGALAVPGKLTQRYFEGKHIRYYHPVRLFIVSAGIFTALVTYRLGKLDLGDFKIGLDKKKEAYEKNRQYLLLDSLAQTVSSAFDDRQVDEALDTLKARFKQTGTTADVDININFQNGNMLVDTLDKEGTPDPEPSDSVVINQFPRFGDKDIKVAITDLLNLSEEKLLDKYGVKGWKNRLLFRQYVRLTKGGAKFFLYVIGNVIWMVLIMMPMLALVLKLLHIRRHYYYYEHLVFSFHTHSFVFLLFALLIALDDYLSDSVISVIFLLCFVYLFLAMKRFYGQGLLKTFLKFFLANFLYLLVASVAALLTLMASAFLY